MPTTDITLRRGPVCKVSIDKASLVHHALKHMLRPAEYWEDLASSDDLRSEVKSMVQRFEEAGCRAKTLRARPRHNTECTDFRRCDPLGRAAAPGYWKLALEDLALALELGLTVEHPGKARGTAEVHAVGGNGIFVVCIKNDQQGSGASRLRLLSAYRDCASEHRWHAPPRPLQRLTFVRNALRVLRQEAQDLEVLGQFRELLGKPAPTNSGPGSEELCEAELQVNRARGDRSFAPDNRLAKGLVQRARGA